MSAAEDDTELRDLLLQNLENSGVLSRLKAQMRAAVFLAMEEQDRIENKAPLVNEKLKNCLNTRDGAAAASLVLDFLQVFDLDFTVSVFEPEINSKHLQSRDLLCKDLDLKPKPKSPLLLDLVQRRVQDQTKDQSRDRTKDQTQDQTKDQTQDHSRDQAPSDKQLLWVRRTFDFYDKDGNGFIDKDDVKRVFYDLFPQIHRTVLDQFVLEQLRDQSLITKCQWESVRLIYNSLFALSSSVVQACGDSQDSQDRPAQLTQRPEAKGDSALNQDPDQDLDQQDPEPQRDLDLDVDDGDSFFDDPLPVPQKTYGWKPESPVPSLSLGPSSSSEPSRPGASKAKGTKDSKPLSDRSGSHRLDEDVEYDDDFNSHRSSLSHSELSIGEEIEEVSIEGPDPSEKTQDLSVSQLSLGAAAADYMEDVP